MADRPNPAREFAEALAADIRRRAKTENERIEMEGKLMATNAPAICEWLQMGYGPGPSPPRKGMSAALPEPTET